MITKRNFLKLTNRIAQGIGLISFLSFGLLYSFGLKFIGIFILFCGVLLILTIFTVLPYDLSNWNNYFTKDTRRMLNSYGRVTFVLFAAVIVYFWIIPYYFDIQAYIQNKPIIIKRGVIEDVDIEPVFRGSYTCTILVNGIYVDFQQVSRIDVIEIYDNLKKGQIVTVKYLPNSKQGIEIELSTNMYIPEKQYWGHGLPTSPNTAYTQGSG